MRFSVYRLSGRIVTVICLLTVSYLLWFEGLALLSQTKNVRERVLVFTQSSHNGEGREFRLNENFSKIQNKYQAPEIKRMKSLPTQKNSSDCRIRLPDAILIGSQKSGTGALLNFLNYHPQIRKCKKVEPNYFSRYYNHKSFEWYLSLMPCATDDQIVIEKSPEYFYNKETAVRIKKANPNMKIMLIVKHPITVAQSVYSMWKALNNSMFQGKTFKQMVTKRDGSQLAINPESRIIKIASFALFMRHWYEVFDKKQICVLDGMKFEDSPWEELTVAETFLNITPFFTHERFVFNETKGKYCYRTLYDKIKCLSGSKGRKHPDIPMYLHQLLDSYFKPLNKAFMRLTEGKFNWS